MSRQPKPTTTLWLLPTLLTTLVCAGCASLAEDVATHLAAQDVKAIDQELTVVEGDLASFRTCLSTRGGSCQGDDVLGKANKALSNVFKVSNVGFVSRDTTFSARLPTLEVTLDPTALHLLTLTDVDTGQLLTSKSDLAHLGVVSDKSGVGTGASIGADLVRVFLEAIFDAHEGLRAVVPPNLGARPTGTTLGTYSLPAFQAPTGHVDSHDLTVMTDLNSAVALKTRLLVGRAVSGVGPFSLDNPPLESLITEIVATSVRKAMEKATWCWYACNLDADMGELEKDVGEAAESKLRQEEQKTWSGIDREAEHVKLRLKLGK